MPLFIKSQLIEDDYYPIVSFDDCRWYPVYCKPNKEKQLVELAVSVGISCYLPTLPHSRVTRGHRIDTQIPMFPGYVFLCLNRLQNWQIKASNLILRILQVTEESEPRLIEDLNIIRKFEKLSRTQPVSVRADLIPGKRVIIAHGDFKGIEGIIVKKRNRTEFIVRLDFLGLSLAIIPATYLI